MRVQGLPNVLAAGDCAHLINNPCPKAGVFAVRQGPPLAANIRRVLRGELESTLEKYIPQRSFLGIIGTADGRAVASKGKMGVEGEWLWDLKDWIDNKWMSGYTTQLPIQKFSQNKKVLSAVVAAAGEQVIEELFESSMRCGGCGSKVGASILSRVLQQMTVNTRPEIVIGMDQPDDCALVQLTKTSPIMAQTVDYFKSFWRDEYIFGQIAANHALSDVHSMGAEAVSAMCIAQVPFGPRNKVEQRLVRLMRGAVDFLNKENCTLVGGHTSEGAELAMGFAITGTILSTSPQPMRKSGARVGDLLILTKPLGTGVILAGHMRILTKGSWVQEAIESMLVSNRIGGICLRDHGATSCTDVTGFGLVGHLVEMLRSSESPITAILNMEAIPLLNGAQEIVQKQKVLSSLHRENVRAAIMIENAFQVSKHPTFPLLLTHKPLEVFLRPFQRIKSTNVFPH